MRSVARQVVKKELRKTIELKHITHTIALTDVDDVPAFTSIIPNIAQGVNRDERIGDHVNAKRIAVNFHLEGPIYGTPGSIDSEPCFVRLMVVYIKGVGTGAADHMCPAWDEFTSWEQVDRENRPYIFFDKVYQLGARNGWSGSGGPVGSTAWIATVPNQSKCFRFFRWNKKINFTQEYDDVTFTGGNLGYYAVTNLTGADLPRIGFESKLWYTDA